MFQIQKYGVQIVKQCDHSACMLNLNQFESYQHQLTELVWDKII